MKDTYSVVLNLGGEIHNFEKRAVSPLQALVLAVKELAPRLGVNDRRLLGRFIGKDNWSAEKKRNAA